MNCFLFNILLGGRGESGPVAAPIFSGNFSIPDAPVGTEVIINLDPYFATGGLVATYSMLGTLPAGLAIIGRQVLGTLTTAATYSDYGIRGTNATNYADSNLDSMFVGPLVEATNFYGHKYIDTTSIDVSGGIVTAMAAGNAPFMLHASASAISGVATRLYETLPVDFYEHFEYRWTVTNEDGSAVQYFNEVTDNRVGDVGVVNPYIDVISPDMMLILRDPQTYKGQLSIKGIKADGVTFETATVNFDIVVAKPVGITHRYYDIAGGNNANDGNDPIGVSLTNASYIEATGALTEAGKFTGYDHAAATASYSTNNFNFIYVDGALREIASKTNDGEIILKDKLGSNKTGLASSNGPKQNWNGIEQDNTIEHLRGGSYDVSSSYKIWTATKTVQKGIVAWDGRATILSSTIGTDGYLLDGGVGSTRYLPETIVFSNVIFDCQYSTMMALNFTCTSTVDVGTHQFIYDRTDWIRAGLTTAAENSASGRAIQMLDYATTGTVGFWGGLIDNLHSPANPSGEYRKSGIYTEFGDTYWQGRCGLFIDADADDAVFDHYSYSKGSYDHYYLGWVYYRHSNTGIGYAENNDNSAQNTTQVRKYFAWHDCQQDNGRNGWDGSNSSNRHDQGLFKHQYLARNSINSEFTMVFAFNILSYFAVANRIYLKNPQTSAVFTNARNTSYTYTDANYSRVLQDNLIYNGALHNDSRNLTAVTKGHTAIFDNIVVNQGASEITLLLDAGSVQSQVAKGNTLRAPNYVSGNHLNSGGSNQDLAAFNTAIGYTNNDTDPQWNDPANGDFSTGPVAPVAPVFSGTLSLPDGVEGEVYSYDASGRFSGAITTYTLETGVMGSEITYNLATCVFSSAAALTVGVPDLTGITISASNGALKSAISNTADIVINPAVPATQQLTFDGADTHATFSNKSLGIGDTATQIFNSNNLGSSRYLFDSTSGIRGRFSVNSSNRADFDNSRTSFTIDGNNVGWNSDISAYMDGNDHPIVLTATSPVVVNVIGQHKDSWDNWDGVLKELEFNIGGTITKWNIDSGSTTTEAASIGTGDMTFVNVVAGDWS
ncbi:MAG: hypothetical protein COB23_03240 [Methylophaga sp.]|nr:MAG: hypothetical protein COB23_03240 [Methylophaga sp.]